MRQLTLRESDDLHTVEWAELRFPGRTSVKEVNATVLTGNQCSGKTTMIEQLSNVLPVQEEGISQCVQSFYALDRGDRWEGVLFEILQTSLAKHVIGVEAHYESGDKRPLVTDRGLGDFLGFMYFGRLVFTSSPDPLQWGIKKWLKAWNPPREPLFKLGAAKPAFKKAIEGEIEKIHAWNKVIKYQNVLWLPRTKKFVRDGKRERNPLARMLMGACLKKAWHDLGYDLIRVPRFTGQIKARAEHIFEIANRKGKTSPHPLSDVDPQLLSGM